MTKAANLVEWAPQCLVLEVRTHLAGLERKRSRSLLLMDHGGQGTCIKSEKIRYAARCQKSDVWSMKDDACRCNESVSE